MGDMITGVELRSLVESGELMTAGDAGSAEGVKYDFHLSPRILKAEYRKPINADQLSETTVLVVEPGEVVFVLTSERLNLPLNVVAQLSPKRKLSHAGIMTLGGLCVDPGYEGRILLGLFNLSSTPFPLQPGKKLIAATFYRLSEAEAAGIEKPKDGALDDFPDELVQVMEKYKPIAAHALAEKLGEVQSAIDEVRSKVGSHEDWYRDFKASLETLHVDLKAEVKLRSEGQGGLEKAVAGIEKNFSFLRGATYIGLGILSVIFAIFLAWLSWYFGFRASQQPIAPAVAPTPAVVTSPVATSTEPPAVPKAPAGTPVAPLSRP